MSHDAMSLCAIDGNQDLYGSGIRLGIYFQLIATILVNNFLPNEVSGAWDTNSIFLLAVFAAVAKATGSRTIHYVEAFVMLQLMFAFLLAVVPTNSRLKWRLRAIAGIMEEKDVQFLVKNLSSSKVGRSWRAYLALAIACYNVWFWFKFEAPTSCRAYIFLFAKVSPQPVSQQFFRAFSVIYLLWKGTRLLKYLAVLFSYFFVSLGVWKGREGLDWTGFKQMLGRSSLLTIFLDFYYRRGKKASESDLKYVERLRRHQDALRKDIFWKWRFSQGRLLSRWWNTLSAMFSVVAITWFVLAVELTLSWNSVGSVYSLSSTGQLIPFITGLLGLVRSVHLVAMKFLELKYRSMSRPEFCTDQPTASWRYRLNDGSFAQFDASNFIKRSRSLDARNTPSEPPAKCKRVVDLEKGDHIRPALPLSRNLSSTSLLMRTLRRPDQVRDFLNRRVFYMDMGEWRYPLKDGSQQIFAADDCGRRWSFDEQDLYNGLSPYRTNPDQSNLEKSRMERSASRSSSASSHWQEHSNEDHEGIWEHPKPPHSNGEYALKDGRKIIFPEISWYHDDEEASPVPFRRFSYDDKDGVSYDVRAESLMSTSSTSSTISENSEDNEAFRNRRRQHKIAKGIAGFFCVTFCCPCFAFIVASNFRKQGRQRGDPSTSKISLDTSLSERTSRTPWGIFKRRILGAFSILFCGPCMLPLLYRRKQKERKRKEMLERIERREAFEEAYIRRHGARSKPYLQSRDIREWSQEQQGDGRDRIKRALELVGRVLKSAFEMDLSFDKTDPGERKAEVKSKLPA